jgi:hypothetical protein
MERLNWKHEKKGTRKYGRQLLQPIVSSSEMYGKFTS